MKFGMMMHIVTRSHHTAKFRIFENPRLLLMAAAVFKITKIAMSQQ